MLRRVYSVLSRTSMAAPKPKAFHSTTDGCIQWALPVSCFQDSGLKSYAQLAVEYYNDDTRSDNQKIEFVEIVKGRGRMASGFIYFLTLKTKDGQGVTRLFETKVSMNPFHEAGTQVIFGKLKPISSISPTTPEPDDPMELHF